MTHDHTQEPIQKCCEKCSIPDYDAVPSQTGYVDDPTRCGDEDCPCHQPPIYKVSDVVREFADEFSHIDEVTGVRRFDFFRVTNYKKSDPIFKDDQVLLDAENFIRTNLTTLLSSIVEQIEGAKKKHWVFECDGAHGGKGCYETWCGDDSSLGACTSKDAIEVRAHNAAIDRAITIIKSSME